MAPFPFNVTAVFGVYSAYLVYLLIGFAFGYTLEIAGFGNSLKLARQFCLSELTVLKVMFTAIVVAMVLIFGASAVGLLNVNLIWVNPTYLWPGVVGGLIMGVGFIVGGFCPGTSLVALSTFKIDGLFYALGVLFGIFLFGETVDGYSMFWTSSYMGRLTLPEVFGLSTGWVVLLVVLMALLMFWGTEQLERIFGGLDPKDAPRARYLGAGALGAAAALVLVIGQLTTSERWARIAAVEEAKLANREVQLQPGEELETMHDPAIKLVMLDVRQEADYNLFHRVDARHVPLGDLPELIPSLRLEPANTVFLVMSNDEAGATQAYKTLVAESIANSYILEGGINGWLAVFAAREAGIQRLPTARRTSCATFSALPWGGLPGRRSRSASLAGRVRAAPEARAQARSFGRRLWLGWRLGKGRSLPRGPRPSYASVAWSCGRRCSPCMPSPGPECGGRPQDPATST